MFANENFLFVSNMSEEERAELAKKYVEVPADGYLLIETFYKPLPNPKMIGAEIEGRNAPQTVDIETLHYKNGAPVAEKPRVVTTKSANTPKTNGK